MGYFLTAKSRIIQTEMDGFWKLQDNELYLSTNNVLYLTPRYFWSDGYTIPAILAPIIGDKHKYDVRPSHLHDLGCRFHQLIIVKLSIAKLKQEGYIHEHKGIIVCEDLPLEYLQVIDANKILVDNLLRESMLSCGINKHKCNVFRLGVTFNLHWLKTGKKSILDYDIFKEDIGLVNGL